MNKSVFTLAIAVIAVSAVAQPWSDNFDSYATGSQMHGQGGWKGWDNSLAAGALTSGAQASSAPNSVDIVGGSDLVHTFAGATSGQWVFAGQTYHGTAFSGQSLFIMLNIYNDGGPYNWSTQVQFDGGAGTVSDFDVPASTMAMVRDQWVDFRNEIDLDANTQSFFYNNQLLFTKSWTEGVSGGGAVDIGAIDLFANGATSMYYDNLSLTAVPEPASMLALGLGAAALLRRKRRA